MNVKKYLAMTEDRVTMSLVAESLSEARRMFEIYLRGRPGPDYYGAWMKDGAKIIEGE